MDYLGIIIFFCLILFSQLLISVSINTLNKKIVDFKNYLENRLDFERKYYEKYYEKFKNEFKGYNKVDFLPYDLRSLSTSPSNSCFSTCSVHYD